LPAFVYGDLVWIVIGLIIFTWFLLTFFNRKLKPDLLQIINMFFRRFVTRMFLLLIWAEIGWHLFNQHP
jgi:hypothetical protein